MRSAVVPVALVCLLFTGINAHAQDALINLDAQAARVSRAARGGRLAPPGLSRVEAVRTFLRNRHDPPTVRDLLQTREHVQGGVVHLTFGQQVAGLDVYGTYLKATFNSDGDLVSVVENLVSTAPALRPARVGPDAALQAVLARYYPGVSVPNEISSVGNVVTYEQRPPFRESPRVIRMAVPLRGNALDTGYLVITWDQEQNRLRHTVVSGAGAIIHEQLRTSYDSYRIFPKAPGVTAQVLVTNPADPVASPAGWLGASTTTTGNNVDAYLERDNDDAPDANGRPIAPDQLFDYEWDGAVSPLTTTNQQAAVTNLFYLNNLLHDRLYRYGFTESAGNFQMDNFGRGGIGNDPVNAEAQDGGGMNNANFATPPDGERPRMQMYLWNTASPERDGTLDSDIVYHEYGHGLTWRIIGDMGGVTGGAVGEGMSDALALYFNGDDRVAEYSSNNPIGIRSAPYTGYARTYALVVGILGPHLDGEIYAATLWRLRQLWLGKGWSQDTLLTHIVDGMHYTPARPAYEDMRDGILQSIANLPTELDPQEASCTVWDAFAQFGIGVGADGSELCFLGLCVFRATESFVKPAECPSEPPANTAPTVTIVQPADGSSIPFGSAVAFSGAAVDDQDGDLTASLVWTSSLQGPIGTGGSFSRSDLVAGTHTITAAVTDSGGLSGVASVTLTVTAPNTAPAVTILQPSNGTTVPAGTSVTFTGTATDAEDGNLSASLVWTSSLQGPIGTGGSFSRSDLVAGTHTITATVTDSGGLSGGASVTLTVTVPNTPPAVTILQPSNGTTVLEGTSVAFTGTATDAEDGNLSAALVWTSNLQGPIGTGASFSRSDLVPGDHAITATVTDSAGAPASAAIVVTVQSIPDTITLSVVTRKVKGNKFVDLAWSGAPGGSVVIFKNGGLLTTVNGTMYTDPLTNKKPVTTVYRVCTPDLSVCSNDVSVTF